MLNAGCLLIYYKVARFLKICYIIGRNTEEVAKITLQQKIKVACDEAGISLTELGAKMGMSQASISKRVKTGKFTQEELEKMASIMGCKYTSAFVFPNGNRIE